MLRASTEFPQGVYTTIVLIILDLFAQFCLGSLQHCHLIIGAYSYQSERMNITNASDFIETHDFQPNGEWHVFRTSAVWNITYLDCCPDIGYSHVRFTLHMKVNTMFVTMRLLSYFSPNSFISAYNQSDSSNETIL